MNVFLYIDASGQSADTRLWGALTLIGQHNNKVIDTIIKNFSTNCEGFRELKGKSLTEEELRLLTSKIQREAQGHFYCKRYGKDGYHKKRKSFLIKLKALQSSQRRDSLVQFYSSLKKMNQVKFICLVETIETVLSLLPRSLNIDDIHIFIDNENFPPGKNLQVMISDYAFATWSHPSKRSGKNKTIYSFPACDSQNMPGIQAIDLFLNHIRNSFCETGHVLIDL